jgi:hypothetical protein
MLMTSSVRKFALTAHVACSVGLLGSIAAFLVLVLTGLSSQDSVVVRAAFVGTDLLANFIIVPLALAALASGIIQSLGTSWGLFRHKWIVAKLFITGAATAILLAKLGLIAQAADLARQTDIPLAALRAAGVELAVHAAAGLLVLLIPTALSIYKPRGLTAYGLRTQKASGGQVPQKSGSAPAHTVHGSSDGVLTFTLRRSHLFAGFIAILAAHVLVLHAVGMGPGVH